MQSKQVLYAPNDTRWNRKQQQQQNNAEKNWLYKLMFDAGLLLLRAVKSILVRSQLFIQFQLFFFQRLVHGVHVLNRKYVITCNALFLYLSCYMPSLAALLFEPHLRGCSEYLLLNEL